MVLAKPALAALFLGAAAGSAAMTAVAASAAVTITVDSVASSFWSLSALTCGCGS
jgi:hypothetical protein